MPERRVLLIAAATALFFLAAITLLEPSISAAIAMQVHPELHASVPAAFLRARMWIVVAAIYTCLSLSLIFRRNEANPLALAVFSSLITILVVTRALQFPYCIDDAYIYFKYVANIVEHWRPEYELGSKAMGFTSHLHVLLLSVLSLVSACRDLPLIAQLSNTALDVLAATMLFVMAGRLFGSIRVALLAMALYVFSFFNIGEAFRGKESSMLVFLLTVAIWARLAARPALQSFAAALVALTRPEGIFFLFVTFLSQLPLRKGKMRRQEWVHFGRIWLAPSLLLLAVYGFLLFYFGTLLPQGMLAKSTIYRLPPFLCAEQIGTHLMHELTGCELAFTGVAGLIALSGLTLFCLALLWEYSALRVYLVSLLLVTAFFCSGNALMKPFPWYFAWWTLLAPLTLSVLFQAATRQLNAVRMACAAAAFLLALLVFSWHSCLYPGPYARNDVKMLCLVSFPLPIFSWDVVQERVRLYEEAARYLNASNGNLKLVATSELGIVGYTLRSRVLDLHGMTDPEMLKLYPVPLSKFSPTNSISFPPEFASRYKPDRILTLDTFVRNGLLADRFFLDHYEMERYWPCKVWGSDYLILFKQKGN